MTFLKIWALLGMFAYVGLFAIPSKEKKKVKLPVVAKLWLSTAVLLACILFGPLAVIAIMTYVIKDNAE